MQQARESARLVACRNNLKQVSLAVLRYEAVYSTLPSGGLRDTIEEASAPNRSHLASFSWAAPILPFLDLSANAEVLDRFPYLHDAVADPQALSMMQVPVAVIACPSDLGPAINDELPFVDPADPSTNLFLAKSNYVANHKSGSPTNDALGLPAAARGLFGISWAASDGESVPGHIRSRDVTGGVSNTMLLRSESTSGPTTQAAGTTPRPSNHASTIYGFRGSRSGVLDEDLSADDSPPARPLPDARWARLHDLQRRRRVRRPLCQLRTQLVASRRGSRFDGGRASRRHQRGRRPRPDWMDGAANRRRLPSASGRT